MTTEETFVFKTNSLFLNDPCLRLVLYKKANISIQADYPVKDCRFLIGSEYIWNPQVLWRIFVIINYEKLNEETKKNLELNIEDEIINLHNRFTTLRGTLETIYNDKVSDKIKNDFETKLTPTRGAGKVERVSRKNRSHKKSSRRRKRSAKHRRTRK